MREIADAVVIGSGPNGLAAANVLVDAGWDVVVLEAADEPGGAVRSGEVTAPGFTTDLFSAFYPLGAASPVFESFDLESYGLTWLRSPAVVANPLPDGRAAVVTGDPARTAAGLDADCPGDGAAWLELIEEWSAVADPLLGTLLGPFPPVRAAARLGLRLGPRGLRRFGRMALVPARTLAHERFRGEQARAIVAGAAAHTDIVPEGAGSGLLAWLLLGLAETVGFPTPEGGAGALTDALVRRLQKAGGRLECSTPVERLELQGRRVGTVHVAGGATIRARRAVIATTSAEALYQRLLPADVVPNGILQAITEARADPGPGIVKVDWALSGPIPWAAPAMADAACVHFADSMDELTFACAEVNTGRAPSRPPMLLGQMTTVDPTRSPPGTESVWGYVHVPHGWSGPPDDVAATMEARIEERAPGFGARVLARHVAGPADLEAADANLLGGDLAAGGVGLHRQLVWRPTPGLGRTETPFPGLFLGSASAHPGPGVHGMVGAHAARAALRADGPVRRRVTAPLRAALR